MEDTGKKVRKLGTLRSRAHPFMLANVDRAVMGEEAGLEIKTAGVNQAKKWKGDEIPDSYYCQCLHYLTVTGADRWYIAVLIGGNEAIRKTVERNDEDIKALIEAERDFWDHVVTRTPPPVDGSASCAAALSERFKGGGESIILPSRTDTMIESLQNDKSIMDALKSRSRKRKRHQGTHGRRRRRCHGSLPGPLENPVGQGISSPCKIKSRRRTSTGSFMIRDLSA